MIDVYLCLLYHPSAGARWQSGYAAVCKTVYIGSIPVRASIFLKIFSTSKVLFVYLALRVSLSCAKFVCQTLWQPFMEPLLETDDFAFSAADISHVCADGYWLLRPFDTISGQALGFTPTQIGLVASGHFAGFLIGCVCSPFLVKRVGHSRAFAAMAGVAVMSIIAHPLHPDPYFWAFVRVFSGFAVAGCYTLIESWLQAKVTNNIRGRVFGVSVG